ncbi:NfeD family protein [[Eubacterium] cellulosolvens]
MRRRASFAVFFLAGFLALQAVALTAYASTEPRVMTVELSGTITSSTAEMVAEATRRAEREAISTVVLLIDTPGGLLSATMAIIDTIERSTVPFIAYVYPSGARAWSAGTFILMASHVAAMAPHTIIGSSQPVNYSPLSGSEPVADPKTVNALTAFMVERARAHGRNETAARAFIEQNLNLNAEEALAQGVIEILSPTIAGVVSEADGRVVQTFAGEVTLRTTDASVEEYGGSLRIRLLSIISDPLLASVALLVGLYALVFGISSPGYGAEVIGALLLVIGLIGVGLNISIGSLILIVIGAVLMIAEAYTPGFGLLGGAGFVFVVLGSLLLVPLEGTRWIISPEWYVAFVIVILSASLVVGAFTLFMVYKIVRARRLKPFIGELIGQTVEVVDEIQPGGTGYVKYRGEYWKAKSRSLLRPGDSALITGKDGPMLMLSPRTDEL